MTADDLNCGIPIGMCEACGFVHPAEVDCIAFLRDRIAELEFKLTARMARLKSA